MKSRFMLTLLIIALTASTLTAHANDCDNGTIRGTYAFTLHGQILLPNGAVVRVDGIDKVTFDGYGKFVQYDAVAENGSQTKGWRAGSGTYSVNPDCTGYQTIVVAGLPDLHLQFIIAQTGNTIHQVVTDPGFNTTAEGERLRK